MGSILPFRSARRAAERAVRNLTTPWSDAAENRRWATADKRVLIVRYGGQHANCYRPLLEWLEREFPEVRRHFELHTLPGRIHDWSPYVLHVPWLAEDLIGREPYLYAQAKRLEYLCQAAGIPLINPIDRVLKAAKSSCTRTIAKAGIRTPDSVPITDVVQFRSDHGGLKFPYFIREDRSPGGLGRLHFIEKPADLEAVPLERLKYPVAVEFIDVKGRDGLFRKYRYLAAGDYGVTRHLLVASHWQFQPQQQVATPAARDEELDFCQRPDPNHAAFQRARRGLGLDFVAFDYSYDRAGRVVVWEASTLPALQLPESPEQNHRLPLLRFSLAALAHLYLERGHIAIPQRLRDVLDVYASGDLAHSRAA